MYKDNELGFLRDAKVVAKRIVFIVSFSVLCDTTTIESKRLWCIKVRLI
ncbi:MULTISPECIES: hypothetical protein [unclassified Shewanella]|nr:MULTISPECIES: hypothetical protein [unclassified Shewanella]